MIVAATGFFDGVHLGHKSVIDAMNAYASSVGGESMIVTFWPHPRVVLQQDADKLKLLNSLREKKALCEAYGVKHFETIPFDLEMSRMSAKDFITGVLSKSLGVDALILGYDHRLGHDRFTSPRQMVETVESCSLKALRIEELSISGETVSSTAIRKALSEGRVEQANAMLGYRYGLEGVVVAGNHIGRTINFPTANLSVCDPQKLVPGSGVYVVAVKVLGKIYKGICNIGVRPTVGQHNVQTIETHILDFDQDIYGYQLQIEFIRRLRDEQRFGSLSELKLQLELDKAAAQAYIFEGDGINFRNY